jgi:predicted DNA-binding transcriptional regulator YafY
MAEPLKNSFITFSINNYKDLKIKYRKQGQVELRDIKPIKLRYTKSGNVILIAFDNNKDAWRSFALDKIQYVKIKNK